MRSTMRSDGAGFDLLIARMLMKRKSSTPIQVYDPMKDELKKLSIKILGKESVTVPAGPFEAYKIEVAYVDALKVPSVRRTQKI